MEFFTHKFKSKHFTLYPLADIHYGSLQCNVGFFQQVIKEIEGNPNAYWVGMGDFMENAVIGSKSDVYTQTVSPKVQMERIVEMLKPIKKKGLFLIGGNHEQRSHRLVGLIPEQYIGIQLGIPYKGFSCLANLQVEGKTPNTFICYFHHNYGGGYTKGGKVNRAESLRRITPGVNATFSAHFHTTSRIPAVWYEAGRTRVIKRTGYDYITGSALEWSGSYAEERAKPSASCELIKVTFIGCTNGRSDNRKQIYEVIMPHEDYLGDKKCTKR